MTVTETTVAVAGEAPVRQRMTLEELLEKLPWPLAVETLADHPQLHLALGSSSDLAELLAEPVYVSDEDRGAWRAEDEALEAEISKYRAEVITGAAEGLKRATENLWPTSAQIPDEEVDAWVREQHQHASVTDLSRWSRGKTFAEDAQADKAATRFLEAFSEDPEGDTDRARLQPLPEPGGPC